MSQARDKATRTATGCVFALLVCGSVAIAQEPAPVATPEKAAASPVITSVAGQLTIDALDLTLAEVLTKVGALTGVKIDIPPAASNQRMPMVRLGPGPAREVLAQLLSDSSVDYMIQASDTDPDKIQSVLVMIRDKKGAKGEATEEVARSSRSPYSRRAAALAEREDAPAAASAQPENAAAEPISVDPAPATAAVEPPAPPPPTEPLQNQQPGQLNGTRISPQPIPSSLDSQGISQQLQQMYQQRVQITQQERPIAPPAPPGK